MNQQFHRYFQLLKIYWFRQIGECPGFQSLQLIGFISSAGYEHDGGVAGNFANLLAELKTRFIRQMAIEQIQVEAFALGQAKAISGGPRQRHFVARHFQQDFHHLTRILIVFDAEDAIPWGVHLNLQ